jgi:PAS domain S-box-containing protein
MSQKPTYEELKNRVRELEKVEVECKKSEEALQKKMQRFRDLAESTSDWIWEVDLKGMYTYSNHKVTEFLGYELEEIIGKTPFELMPIDESKRVSDLYNTFLSSQSSFESIENVNIHKNGSRVVMETSGVPIFDNEGGLLGYRGIDRDITHRKNVEEGLRNSEAKHKALVLNFPGMVYSASPDWSAEIISGSLDICGYTEKEMNTKEKNWLSIIHHDDIEKVFEDGSKLTQVQKNIVQKYRINTKEGDIRWVEDRKTSIFSEKGDFMGIDGIVFDITERKMAAEALRASHERFLTVLNSLDATIYVSDMATDEILFVNKSMIENYGRDMTGEVCWDVFRGESGPCPHCNKDQLIDGNNNPTGVHVWQDKNPITGKWFINYDRAIEWTDGRLAKLQIATDITERKQIEEELRISEEHYREYFEENISASYISSPEGQLIACNEEYRKIFEFDSIKHALDTPITNFYNDSNERNNFLNIIKKEKRVTGFEPKLMRPDGTPVHLLENASGVFDEDGNLKQIRGFLLDVTEQKNLEAQLQQAQKIEAIGTLAGGIAHDFNNILFPVIGHTEMLLEDVPEDSPFRNSLKEIYTSVLRAKDLVKQILTFSRQDSGELILMKMQPIIKEALKLIRSTIPTTIEIKQDINPDCGVIKADPTQIHQIVMNLTTNAFHAMEQIGGLLKVSLKEIELGGHDIITPDMIPGIYACLTVADTGTGMDKNLTDKIFDPFFTTKEKGKGTGMGLSVVHGIVTVMGGYIQVYSKPGKGTQFLVYLPVEKSLSEKQETNSTAEEIQGGVEQILLVDDEEAILTMEKLMLERLGYQVTSRTSSLEALEAFRADPDKFDLIITDMAMPNMRGDKLSAELIKIRPDIPVLLCSGFSEVMSEKKATSLGIKGFLMKPIVMKDLAQKIREVLE